MIFVAMIQAFLVLAEMISVAVCHVLVAGNEDTFRSLAKNFVPRKLADQLVHLVSQDAPPEPTNVEGDEYTNQDQAYDVREYNSQNEDQDPGAGEQPEYDDQVAFRNDHLQPQLPQSQRGVRRPQAMQVNLDQLVEKVRARLLDELKANATLPTGTGSRSPRQQPKQPPMEPEDTNFPTPQNTPARVNKRLKPASVKQPLKPTRADKPGELIESHDLYEKFKLSKHKTKQKDSYEDYIAKVPKPAGDEFESEEHKSKSDKIKKLKALLKLRQEKRSSLKMKTTTESYNTNNDNTERNNNEYLNNEFKNKFNNNNNNMNRKHPKRTRQTTETTQNYKNNKNINQFTEDVEENGAEMTNEPKTKTTKQETTPMDEDIDEFATTASTVEQFPKAATEFIGGDWDDPPVERQTEPQPAYPFKKRPPKKIATNMAIRLRYTIKTPNYYDKLPRIAEKYNFDEPIPEKDQEEEHYKPMMSPPTNINGKVKVN